jgi:hypothetical protein
MHTLLTLYQGVTKRCALEAQMNFGDLTPHLTYAFNLLCVSILNYMYSMPAHNKLLLSRLQNQVKYLGSP